MREDFEDQALHPGHHSIRFPGYDYSSEGLYFVTICSHQKRCVLGRIVEARTVLSPVGVIVRKCWVAIPSHFARTRLHEFVIMPNHLHGIGEICAKPGRSSAAPLRVNLPRAVPPGSLGAIVRSFKAAVTKRVHDKFQVSGPVWQRNYFERVVRDGEE